ncbi:hypothetical protein LZ30DRAFT_729919 [Colletotrichum cereale]|nr:hypothetical protein LZ30DRAFT_729919 [Colletotrichum cereale]
MRLVWCLNCCISYLLTDGKQLDLLHDRRPRSHHALSVPPAAPDSSGDRYPGIILASDQRILPRWVHGVAWLGLWLEPGPLQGPGTGPVAEKRPRIIFIGSANGTGIGIGDRDRGGRRERHTVVQAYKDRGRVSRADGRKSKPVSRKSVSHRCGSRNRGPLSPAHLRWTTASCCLL